MSYLELQLHLPEGHLLNGKNDSFPMSKCGLILLCHFCAMRRPRNRTSGSFCK
jgi:hypothetical protein